MEQGRGFRGSRVQGFKTSTNRVGTAAAVLVLACWVDVPFGCPAQRSSAIRNPVPTLARTERALSTAGKAPGNQNAEDAQTQHSKPWNLKTWKP
jgi:hypothetical protein